MNSNTFGPGSDLQLNDLITLLQDKHGFFVFHSLEHLKGHIKMALLVKGAPIITEAFAEGLAKHIAEAMVKVIVAV